MSRVVKDCLVGIAIALLLGGTATAQKFAFVDSEKIKQNYKEWRKAEETFNTEMQAWDEEANRMYQEYKQDSTEFENQKLILSADKKTERIALLNAKLQALESFTREISAPGGKAEQRMNELVMPLYDEIQSAIEKVAIEENYDFVFNSGGLAYARKELDITDKVIEILESED